MDGGMDPRIQRMEGRSVWMEPEGPDVHRYNSIPLLGFLAPEEQRTKRDTELRTDGWGMDGNTLSVLLAQRLLTDFEMYNPTSEKKIRSYSN
jgi:hypothetical protein